MAAQVEARSLSAINSLAANPPQYPVNPTEENHESLTLYISRVPGSRGMKTPGRTSSFQAYSRADVILSTFKPQRKNVTVEDVANSLYYVHLDAPSDDHLGAPAPMHLASPTSSSGQDASKTSRPPIQRKPLPPNAQVSKLDNPAAVATREVTTGTGEPVPQEAWVPPGFKVDDSSTLEAFSGRPPLPPRPPPQDPPPPHSNVQRRPLGPRPMDVRSAWETEATGYRSDNSRVESHMPRTSPRPNRSSAASVPLADARANQTPLRSESPRKSHSPEQRVPFSLTLIRRDPTSGNQWNIGRVSSFQDQEETTGDNSDIEESQIVHDSPRGRAAIDILLESSGYAKFRGFPSRQSVDPYRPPSMVSMPHAGTRASSDETLARTTQEGFSRRVLMSYTKSWTSNIKDAFRRPDRSSQHENSEPDDTSFDLEPPKRPGIHGRQDSVSSLTSVDDSRVSTEARELRDPPPLITTPGPGLRAKGYFFMSPWDGRCEFRTGNGGRSLKCSHTLTSHSTGFNPLVLAQSLRDGRPLRQGGKRGSISSAITGAMPVSELRFNLPSAELFGKKRHSKDVHSRFDRLIGLHRRGSASEEEEEDPPFDMSLGKEHAGGGNRGKRAKLGKLIVHENGLKMLDLVVAANVGIWWGAWERRF